MLENVYLWGENIIQENAKLQDCLLCNGAKVLAGAVIGKGSVLSYGVFSFFITWLK